MLPTSDVTSVTGELLWGRRAQAEPWSTPLTHSSWNVACAAAEATTDAMNAAVENLTILLDDRWCRRRMTVCLWGLSLLWGS